MPFSPAMLSQLYASCYTALYYTHNHMHLLYFLTIFSVFHFKHTLINFIRVNLGLLCHVRQLSSKFINLPELMSELGGIQERSKVKAVVVGTV